MSDDEVSWRNEEVVHPLKGCAYGMMYFTHTGLRNYLQTVATKCKINIKHGLTWFGGFSIIITAAFKYKRYN